jgi:hypothetical protein
MDVVIAIGQHDHVTLVRPVALPLVDGDPARPTGDDVEQDQPVSPGDTCIGQRERPGLEREGLRQLRPEEQRPFEAQVLEG